MITLQLSPDDVEHIIETLTHDSSWADQRIAWELQVALDAWRQSNNMEGERA